MKQQNKGWEEEFENKFSNHTADHIGRLVFKPEYTGTGEYKLFEDIVAFVAKQRKEAFEEGYRIGVVEYDKLLELINKLN